jgi:chemotaxis methyl-accepting protein methylase
MSTATARRPTAIRSDQLALLMRRLQQYAGIRIDSSRGVIAQCIEQRMASLGVDDVDSYMSAFDDSINARAEWLALIDLLTVKETRFFRQPAAFECVAHYVQRLLSEGPAPSELAFWSAGCSTGQEAYSLGMVVEHVVRGQQPWLQWHGVGTDISFDAIHTAQRAVYGFDSVRDVPFEYRRWYLERETQGGWYIAPSIRSQTHFFHSNLLHVNSAPFADFNIVFCQNVLIYFQRDKQRWIIDQLVDRLRPGGLLVLGAGEDVRWLNKGMRRLEWPGVCAYTKTGDSAHD